ncbi:hypothetical protein AGABI1DRAFT_129822 [Agaricus bisporus var. burnettii JB137-S8]|uniref:Uncharacterized protein n=1 Tax=Agaricus bisporus var. burnettii (strain JB137-S8 / ATCC MYA-4627 / FGSC 10392) TaxID=597362 RepID=K5X527_AGABU|nr:uncharacterized protein AGABI1DRAFT_129822 [Agaricus bisporus var. burnettii JB137-S8]EKM78042.1 hypothetical protein AGABI1DRAFT_129822 [Agaricus bisporus var. burnettii JB137-S8]
MNQLQHSLSALSEDQLRKMVARVVSKDPYFCDVIAMELGETEVDRSSDGNFDDVSTTMTSNNDPSSWKKNRKRSLRHRSNRPRTLSNTFVHFPPTSFNTDSDQEEYHCYHSGHLETEEYEFLTGRTGVQAFGVQTVFMWSCCEGDETSPGCTASSANRHGYSEPTNLGRRCPQKKNSKSLSVRRRRA